ncbi:MAG: dehydrogenase component, partial [Bacteroidetes bacterium]|nr:dehydrogenase component [Bacteroidota bacterium]
MYFDRTHISDDQLLGFYKALLYPRLVEEKMLLLLRQGKVSKWFSGIGQEAIAVGATLALDEDEWILPLHRNLGVFTTRQMPLQQLFHQWQGSPLGYSKGRERSFHFGSAAHHIFGMISHLGPQLSVADGIALAQQLEFSGKVTLTFTGEGGTSEGEFHEALNVAAVWGLPVIFLIENNGYGFLEVYHAVKEAKRHALEERQPVLIEAMTFRMRGHEEASGTKYVPAALLEEWAKQDPILHFEKFLQFLNLADDSIRESLKQEIDHDIQAALHETVHVFNLDEELHDIYAPAPVPVAPTGAVSEKRFINAIADALHQAMELHPDLILMGQDIAEYGGAFKITEGLAGLYGKERVRNTPLCESAILGAGLGLSVMGYRSMVEMQFADFVSCGFNQIVNNLAKIHYRWGQNA